MLFLYNHLRKQHKAVLSGMPWPCHPIHMPSGKKARSEITAPLCRTQSRPSFLGSYIHECLHLMHHLLKITCFFRIVTYNVCGAGRCWLFSFERCGGVSALFFMSWVLKLNISTINCVALQDLTYSSRSFTGLIRSVCGIPWMGCRGTLPAWVKKPILK